MHLAAKNRLKNMQGNVDNTYEGRTSQMLMTLPLGGGLVATKRWLNTKRSYMAVFKKSWRKFEGDSPIFDENKATYAEWSDGSYEYKGMCDDSRKRHGISRMTNLLSSGPGNIYEWCLKNESYHGLYLTWNTSGQFTAYIYQDGSSKGYIKWDQEWNEISNSNKNYCHEIFTIDDFRP